MGYSSSRSSEEERDYGTLRWSVEAYVEGSSTYKVSVYRMSDGAHKIALERFFTKRDGSVSWGKLGRLSGPATVALASAMRDAATEMQRLIVEG
jgi:hypothetical protein